MKVYIRTYGCQLNVNDTEVMLGILEQQGNSIVNNLEDADLIILNTCAVRAKSEEKVYGKLGELKRIKSIKPGTLVGIAGCMVEDKRRLLLANDTVDFIIGTKAITRIGKAVERLQKGERKFAILSDLSNELDRELPFHRLDKYHAWVTIIRGCNKFCTYCIVPYTRGRERSRAPESILSEVRQLASSGYREITLLGQNVDSYGKDLPDNYRFSDLLEGVAAINGIDRIWFLTSYPNDFEERVIDLVSSNSKFGKLFHLPIQSGSDHILKLMNRKYSVKQYLSLIDTIRKKIPDAAITTDVIVGFPTETEEAFKETLRVIETVRFNRVNVAAYSIRNGTYAAKHFEDDVPGSVKLERLNKILKLERKISLDRSKKSLNTLAWVFLRGKSKINSKDAYGYTDQFKTLIVENGVELIGKWVQVRITNATSGLLWGEVEKISERRNMYKVQ
ncbi:MAG: tRNA (N6-isopentenyl adenosine(37)-C2)-methylthiotransferase MiaB [Thermotogae bacterium]|nr:tRNA (N6-isopentenyl adenosine(37)-C2)-methylthiotransferase MiaB [Thermotogota bacterium]